MNNDFDEFSILGRERPFTPAEELEHFRELRKNFYKQYLLGNGGVFFRRFVDGVEIGNYPIDRESELDQFEMGVKKIGAFKRSSREYFPEDDTVGSSVRFTPNSFVYNLGLYRKRFRPIIVLNDEGKKVRDKIVLANLGLVSSIYRDRNYYVKGIDFMEFLSEGINSMMYTSLLFDPEKGNKYSTYAYQMLKHLAGNFFGHDKTFTDVERSDESGWDHIGGLATESDLTDVVNSIEAHDVLRLLDERERNVLECVANGVTLKDIAQRLDLRNKEGKIVSKEMVRLIKKDALKKIHEQLGYDYSLGLDFDSK